MSEHDLFEQARKRKIALLRQELSHTRPVADLTADECDRVMYLVKEITRLEYAVALGSML